AAGAVFAWYVSGVFPDSFNLLFSLTMLAMIIIGGMGTVLGPVLGAVIVLIPHQILIRILPQGEPIAIGVSVILIALFLPGGIVGSIRQYVPDARRFFDAPLASPQRASSIRAACCLAPTSCRC